MWLNNSSQTPDNLGDTLSYFHEDPPPGLPNPADRSKPNHDSVMDIIFSENT